MSVVKQKMWTYVLTGRCIFWCPLVTTQPSVLLSRICKTCQSLHILWHLTVWHLTWHTDICYDILWHLTWHLIWYDNVALDMVCHLTFVMIYYDTGLGILFDMTMWHLTWCATWHDIVWHLILCAHWHGINTRHSKSDTWPNSMTLSMAHCDTWPGIVTFEMTWHLTSQSQTLLSSSLVEEDEPKAADGSVLSCKPHLPPVRSHNLSAWPAAGSVVSCKPHLPLLQSHKLSAWPAAGRVATGGKHGDFSLTPAFRSM